MLPDAKEEMALRWIFQHYNDPKNIFDVFCASLIDSKSRRLDVQQLPVLKTMLQNIKFLCSKLKFF